MTLNESKSPSGRLAVSSYLPMRFQLHALAYNLGNFLPTLAMAEPVVSDLTTRAKDNLRADGSSRRCAYYPFFWKVSRDSRSG